MCGCSGGVCMVALGGMHGCSQGGMRGCSWGGVRGCSGEVCVVALGGGMHGCSWGACMVARGGHAWLLRGVCMVAPGGMCGFSDEIQSMSRQYASYWNAFLLFVKTREYN